MIKKLIKQYPIIIKKLFYAKMVNQNSNLDFWRDFFDCYEAMEGNLELHEENLFEAGDNFIVLEPDENSDTNSDTDSDTDSNTDEGTDDFSETNFDTDFDDDFLFDENVNEDITDKLNEDIQNLQLNDDSDDFSDDDVRWYSRMN